MQKRIASDERNYLWTGHIDYVAVDGADHRPIVAFEIDGPFHQDTKQKSRDRMKNKICSIGGLPLYRVPNLENSMKEDEVMSIISETLGK